MLNVILFTPDKPVLYPHFHLFFLNDKLNPNQPPFFVFVFKESHNLVTAKDFLRGLSENLSLAIIVRAKVGTHLLLSFNP